MDFLSNPAFPARPNKRIYQGQPGLVLETLYEVPAGKSCDVGRMVVCNQSGAPATITLHLVADGDVAGDDTKVLGAATIDANATELVDLAQFLEAGATLQALQGTAGAITLTVSGTET